MTASLLSAAVPCAGVLPGDAGDCADEAASVAHRLPMGVLQAELTRTRHPFADASRALAEGRGGKADVMLFAFVAERHVGIQPPMEGLDEWLVSIDHPSEPGRVLIETGDNVRLALLRLWRRWLNLQPRGTAA